MILSEVVFQEDSLSLLVFVLVLIPLSLILRNAKAAREFSGSKEKINNLSFTDDFKLYGPNKKGLNLLVQTICVFCEVTGTEFGIEKCAMSVIEKGKIMKSISTGLPDGIVIKSLQEVANYKYLAFLEEHRFSGKEMKLKVFR